MHNQVFENSDTLSFALMANNSDVAFLLLFSIFRRMSISDHFYQIIFNSNYRFMRSCYLTQIVDHRRRRTTDPNSSL